MLRPDIAPPNFFAFQMPERTPHWVSMEAFKSFTGVIAECRNCRHRLPVKIYSTHRVLLN